MNKTQTQTETQPEAIYYHQISSGDLLFGHMKTEIKTLGAWQLRPQINSASGNVSVLTN